LGVSSSLRKLVSHLGRPLPQPPRRRTVIFSEAPRREVSAILSKRRPEPTARRRIFSGAAHWTSTPPCAPMAAARWDAGSLTPAPRPPTGEWRCGAGSSPGAASASTPPTAATRIPGGHGAVYYVPGPGQRAPSGENAFSCGATASGSRRAPWRWSTIKSGRSPARHRSGRHPGCQGRLGVPPRGPAAPAAVRAGPAERQLVDPGRLFTPLCPAATHAIASAWPAMPARCSTVRGGRRRPRGGGQCSLTGGCPRRCAGRDDALCRRSEARLQAAAQVIPNAEGIERG
jgi:hypothetical protein